MAQLSLLNSGEKMTIQINIKDLDVIFLTYDEPKKDEFWTRIQNIVPRVKRIDGVKGSDAAHKAAGKISETERFIVVDGDNIPDPTFFDRSVEIDESQKDCIFRWRARNIVNGLMYGNGGISCWTKEFVDKMRTHEASDGTDPKSRIEFCYDKKYLPMQGVYSTTYINQSPFQAWRAGFREGVKMCLYQGLKVDSKEFRVRVFKNNYDNLTIWASVGSDEDNGLWAILGARAGCYHTMITDWDYTQVHDFDHLAELWKHYRDVDLYDEIMNLGRLLKNQLGLEIVLFGPEESKFFKSHYLRSHMNRGVNVMLPKYYGGK